MEWYLKCLRQYADFSGRARRKEYWMFYLFNVIFICVLLFMSGWMGHRYIGDFETTLGLGYLLYLIYSFAVFIPSLAVLVRRLHDVGKSGWWFFIAFIPIVGVIWLFVLLVTDSDEDNQYGKCPK